MSRRRARAGGPRCVDIVGAPSHFPGSLPPLGPHVPTATVLAYQTGAGLMDAATPTNGALMAILLAAGVPWSRWMAFMVRGGALMLAVGAAGILAAAWLGL